MEISLAAITPVRPLAGRNRRDQVSHSMIRAYITCHEFSWCLLNIKVFLCVSFSGLGICSLVFSSELLVFCEQKSSNSHRFYLANCSVALFIKSNMSHSLMVGLLQGAKERRERFAHCCSFVQSASWAIPSSSSFKKSNWAKSNRSDFF